MIDLKGDARFLDLSKVDQESIVQSEILSELN